MRTASRLEGSNAGGGPAAIEASRAVDGPALVWFEIAEEQNVWPIMPAGKGLSDLLEIDEGGEE